jgi:hypothetical protein
MIKDRLPQGRMERETFHRIVDQIQGRGVERTSLFLMNEPLLDKRLEEFTAYLKRREPRTRALVFTNGLLLTGDRARSLAEAGLDEIDISVNGFDRETYTRVMQGIDFDTVMENLRQVGTIHRAGRFENMKIKVVGLKLPGTDRGARAFEEATGLPVFMKPVTNRAGLIDTDALGGSPEKSSILTQCQRPFVKAYLLYNGDMVLCNCDWTRTTLIGNVANATLEELWRGETLMAVRRAHLAGRFPDRLPCRECDYPYLI